MTYVAFLRAINVGGRVVKMDGPAHAVRIARLLECRDVHRQRQRHLRDAVAQSHRPLEKAIEKQLHEKLGYDVHTFVRTCDEVAARRGLRAFHAEGGRAGVGIRRRRSFVDPLDASSTEELAGAQDRRRRLLTSTAARSTGCAGANRASRRFRTPLFEKTLGVRSTFRGREHGQEAGGEVSVTRGGPVGAAAIAEARTRPDAARPTWRSGLV